MRVNQDNIKTRFYLLDLYYVLLKPSMLEANNYLKLIKA